MVAILGVERKPIENFSAPR